MEKESEYDEKHVQLFVGKIAFDPHRLIYATIILMVSLAVYNQEAESWSGTPFMDLVVVVFAPLLALSLAHAFSDALDVQIRTGKRSSANERRHPPRQEDIARAEMGIDDPEGPTSALCVSKSETEWEKI